VINLRSLTQLKTLQFACLPSGPPIGDAAVEHLKGLTQLEELYLNYTDLTDDGLAHLRGLERLKDLGIDSQNISDQGLLHLAELKQLTILRLREARFTADGLQRLKQALPRCKIKTFTRSEI
jgi:hypothetical protein